MPTLYGNIKLQDTAEGKLHTMINLYTSFYAASLFISGIIAERMDLRYYLATGLLLTALSNYLFGFGHTAGIHHIAYFYFVNIFLGIVNSTGWPGVVPTLK